MSNPADQLLLQMLVEWQNNQRTMTTVGVELHLWKPFESSTTLEARYCATASYFNRSSSHEKKSGFCAKACA
jgi:hypothetical protein